MKLRIYAQYTTGARRRTSCAPPHQRQGFVLSPYIFVSFLFFLFLDRHPTNDGRREKGFSTAVASENVATGEVGFVRESLGLLKKPKL